MKYLVGLDLGQRADPSALAVLEMDRWVMDQHAICRIRYLERWPLGTSYLKIVEQVCLLMHRVPLNNAPLLVDATGVGRPVIDLFKEKMVGRLHPVMITAGHHETREVIDRLTWLNVPKRNLVSITAVLLQSQRLKVAPDLSHSALLIEELEHFK